MNDDHPQCSYCDKIVKDNARALECDVCHRWIHMICNKLDQKGYDYHTTHPNAPFTCLSCLEKYIPFSSLDNNQFNLCVRLGVNFITNEFNINYAPRIRDQKLFIEVNKSMYNSIHNISNDLDDDEDDDVEINMNCKYYGTDDFIKAKFKEEKTFSVIHLNIHSIERHIEEFRIILQMLDFKFDIICISESKILKNRNPLTSIDIQGYQKPIGTPTESKKGGVLIYVKDGINYKPRSDLNIYKPKELESQFVEIINENETNTIVGVIYRHPCMNPNIFNDEYLKVLTDKMEKENKTKYITGDFNLDLLKTSNHTPTYNFLEILMSQLILPSITIPTRINPINNTIIDNILTNNINPDLKSGNLTVGISDHLPSFIIVPRKNKNHMPKKHNIYKLDTKNMDKENFILDFLNIDWSKLENKEVNIATATFFDDMNELIEKYTPRKKVTQKEFKQRFKPWITDDITSKIKDKNKILNKISKSKNANEKAELRMEFNRRKNEITRLIRISKKDYYERYFTKHKENLGKVWKGIREIINIKAKCSDYPTCIIDNKETITDPVEIANRFNNFYSSVADSILEKRKYNGTKSFKDFLKADSRTNISMALYECDDVEVRNIIMMLNPKKKNGPNSIPTEILQLLVNDICKPLAIIFNLSFNSGECPDLLKIANTIPVFKKDSKLIVSNYRPISLLSNINKILEKLMFKRVYDFLEKNNSIYNLQFGFRSKHSTNHALIDITENIRSALDKGKIAGGIFVDLQKAFDTVNHEILIYKLNHYGIRGKVCDWFTSYLTNRMQYVSILGYNSGVKYMRHGVPQGSVLGLLLFLLYINDLHKAIIYSKVYHSADDTNLLNISNNPKTLQNQINTDLKMLYKWLLANKISLNCAKTESIIFHKPGQKPTFDFKIKMNGHRVRPSDFIKYLGIYLDSTLSGRFHCDILTKKLKRANGMLCKIRHYVPDTELRSIYYAIFSSHMVYGSQIWGQSITTHNEKIFKLQNKALRIISFSDFRAEANPIYRSKHILKLDDQVKLQNCLFVYDFLNRTLPTCFDDYFSRISDVHSTNTITSTLGCLFTPFLSTTRYGLHSITRHCIDDWNFFSKTLNSDLSLLSRPILKQKISLYILNSYDPTYNNNINNNNNNNNINNNNNNRRPQQIYNPRRGRANRAYHNNFYGQLRHDRPRPAFQSRWDDGPVNLI